MKENLLKAAINAQKHAYAPYSNYFVGAAVASVSGAIYAGCNVENAVYPLGQCAERVAIQNMVCAGEKSFQALMLVTIDGQSPCGACRQVMSELAADGAAVYIATSDGIVYETTVEELLPRAFRLR